MDPDHGRSFDQFAAFAAAAERGLATTLEFAKSLALSDLKTAADLAALDPALFGYVQLCDSTLEQQNVRACTPQPNDAQQPPGSRSAW